jgi:hypothetical protein
MPRTWGYILLVIAVLIGVGALVLPVPESIEITQDEAPDDTPARRPPTPQARPRKQAAAPAAEPKVEAPKPKPESFPMQDTTKQRLTNPPEPRG